MMEALEHSKGDEREWFSMRRIGRLEVGSFHQSSNENLLGCAFPSTANLHACHLDCNVSLSLHVRTCSLAMGCVCARFGVAEGVGEESLGTY